MTQPAAQAPSQPGVGLHGKPICTVPGCNRIYRGEQEKKEGIRFHAFPIDESRCDEWLLRFGLEGFRPRMSNLVCSEHFADSAYRQTKVKKMLKDNALPIPVPDNVKPAMVCLVHLCSARSDRPGRYALFPFPTNHPDIIRQWYSFCSMRYDTQLPRTAAVCAKHFHPSDLVQMGENRVHLRLGAVPALYGPQSYIPSKTPAYGATAGYSPSPYIHRNNSYISPVVKKEGSAQNGQVDTVAVVNQKRDAFAKWKNGACSGRVFNNSLDFASYLRSTHGIDLTDYVRSHGHSRIHTEHLDCALCTESVMHDMGAFRRHLLVVHAGVSMEDYFARHVAPKLAKEAQPTTMMRIVVQQPPQVVVQEEEVEEEQFQQQQQHTLPATTTMIVQTQSSQPPQPSNTVVVTSAAPAPPASNARGSAAKRKTSLQQQQQKQPRATRASKRQRGLDMPGI